MTAEWQNSPDADVILRASGGKEFHAHKIILSLASPVFRDMFSVPQLPPTKTSELSIVDVNDPPEVLEMFLQIIYPTPNPPVDDIETLASVIRLADKYNAGVVLDAHKEYLLSTGLDSSPAHIYVIFCVCGREKEAEAAARLVSFTSLASLNSHHLLRLVTTKHYQRLVGFMDARGKRMREILRDRRAEFEGVFPSSCSSLIWHQLFVNTVLASLQEAFEANPRVRVAEALSIVLSAFPKHYLFSPCGGNRACIYSARRLQEYSESVLNDLIKVAEELPWEQ